MEDVPERRSQFDNLEAHQETTWGQIKGVQALHTPWSLSEPCPWTIAIKLLIKSPRGWDTQFLRHDPSVSSFAWQSNKAILFYFTKNSVSEIRFGTGARRPSFQHHYCIPCVILFKLLFFSLQRRERYRWMAMPSFCNSWPHWPFEPTKFLCRVFAQAIPLPRRLFCAFQRTASTVGSAFGCQWLSCGATGV